jgi:hypothetical protein
MVRHTRNINSLIKRLNETVISMTFLTKKAIPNVGMAWEGLNNLMGRVNDLSSFFSYSHYSLQLF